VLLARDLAHEPALVLDLGLLAGELVLAILELGDVVLGGVELRGRLVERDAARVEVVRRLVERAVERVGLLVPRRGGLALERALSSGGRRLNR
jgi:hypothetical protein